MYLPALTVPYAYLDDYAELGWARGLSSAFDFWRYFALNGRPIGGAIELLGFTLTPDIAALRVLRLVSVIGIVLLALVLRRALVSAGMHDWLAAAAAIFVVGLPSFQVYAAWTVEFPFTYAAVLAAIASFVVTSGVDSPGGEIRLRRLGLGSVLLLAAVLVYQPTAMLFWVFAAISMFRIEMALARALRLFAAHIACAAASLGLAYAILEVIVRFYGSASVPRTALVHDVPGKVRWFFSQPLVNALNLTSLTQSRTIAIAVAIFAGAGIALLHRRQGRQALGFLGLAVVLVPLAYAPNLVVRENWPSYRSTGGLSALLGTYVFLALWGIGDTALRPGVRGEERLLARLVLLALSPVLALVSLALVVSPLLHLPDRDVIGWSNPRWLAALAFAGLFFASLAVWGLGRGELRLGLGPARVSAVRLAGLGIAVVVAASVLLAARNVSSLFAKPQSAELALMRRSIAAVAPERLRRLTFRMPGWWQGAAPVSIDDEFGYPSSGAAWVPIPAVYLILREQGRLGRDLTVHQVPPDAKATSTGEPIIDMRRLRRLRHGWTIWTLGAARG